MSEYIHKSHNVSVLMYHFVCPAKYQRVVIDDDVDQVIRETCKEIEKRYEIKFIEVGTDRDHVHFLVQSVPTYSPQKIMQRVKSIIAKEVFAKCPQVKKKLWGGEFWTDGYYVATVSEHGNEAVERTGAGKRIQETISNSRRAKTVEFMGVYVVGRPFDTLRLCCGVVHFQIDIELCASKDDEVVEYAMGRTLSPMMVAEYQLQLPGKSILQKKLQELINMPLLEDGE